MKRKKAVLIGVICAALVLLLMFAGLTYYSYKTTAPPTLPSYWNNNYWNNKGRVLYVLGMYEEAIECFKRAGIREVEISRLG
jgi:tetratricopeptide (TPR) repeat protein